MLIYNLVCLLLQSELPDGDVKVSPQNLTLHLRPGTLLLLYYSTTDSLDMNVNVTVSTKIKASLSVLNA